MFKMQKITFHLNTHASAFHNNKLMNMILKLSVLFALTKLFHATFYSIWGDSFVYFISSWKEGEKKYIFMASLHRIKDIFISLTSMHTNTKYCFKEFKWKTCLVLLLFSNIFIHMMMSSFPRDSEKQFQENMRKANFHDIKWLRHKCWM